MNLFRRLFGCIAIVALGATIGFAAPAASGPGDGPMSGNEAAVSAKTHTLFMGVDVFVNQNKQFYHVRDVSGGSFVIDVNGRPAFVEMNSMFKAPINLRVEQSLKLSRVSAELTKLTGERAYTPGNDPRRELAAQQVATQAALSDRRTNAEAELASASGAGLGIVTKKPLSAVDPSGWSGVVAGSGQDVARASANLTRAEREMTELGGSNSFSKRLEQQLALELYDAMEVNFEVSSGQSLNNPYVVVITRFHAANAKPGQVQNWIYAKSLEPITEKPQRVHVLQGGFPPGFVLEEFQVHLYNRGQEIASNVAPKRVPLTANEAMLYLMIEYLGAHKQDTVAASPALTTLPPDFQSRLSGEGKQPLFVKVSAEGRITAAFLDEACSRRLESPDVAAAMKEIRFKPALERGKPVESVACLKLVDLPLAL